MSIKWGNTEFDDWIEKTKKTIMSFSPPIHVKELSNGSGSVSIMFVAVDNDDPKWRAQFYKSLSHLNNVFNENYKDIFEKEYHAQKMKDYVDNFLIRMNKNVLF